MTIRYFAIVGVVAVGALVVAGAFALGIIKPPSFLSAYFQDPWSSFEDANPLNNGDGFVAQYNEGDGWYLEIGCDLTDFEVWVMMSDDSFELAVPEATEGGSSLQQGLEGFFTLLGLLFVPISLQFDEAPAIEAVGGVMLNETEYGNLVLTKTDTFLTPALESSSLIYTIKDLPTRRVALTEGIPHIRKVLEACGR